MFHPTEIGIPKHQLRFFHLAETALALLSIALIWVDELLDLPHRLFGSPATPVNLTESTFETCVILAAFGSISFMTSRFIRRYAWIERPVSLCSHCKRVKVVGGEWVPLEVYLAHSRHADISHSLCDECLQQHYGRFLAATAASKH